MRRIVLLLLGLMALALAGCKTKRHATTTEQMREESTHGRTIERGTHTTTHRITADSIVVRWERLDTLGRVVERSTTESRPVTKELEVRRDTLVLRDTIYRTIEVAKTEVVKSSTKAQSLVPWWLWLVMAGVVGVWLTWRYVRPWGKKISS